MISGLRKPYNAVLNRSHRLSRGLIAAWVFNEGGGDQVHDLTGRGSTGTMAAGQTWSRTASGPAILGTTATSISVGATPGLGASGGRNLSIAVAGNYATGGNRLMVDWETTGDEQFVLDFHDGELLAGGGTGGNNLLSDANDAVGYHDWVCTRNSSDVMQNIFRDGQAANNAAGGISGIGNDFDIGGRNAGLGCDFDMFYVYVWGRVLVQNEALALHRDPYAMFRAQRRVFKAPAAVAGSPWYAYANAS